MESFLEKINLDMLLKQAESYIEEGEVANYIPELAKKRKNDLAVSVMTKYDRYSSGDINEVFTIQSISKIISLAIVLEDLGSSKTFEKVNVEPTEGSFNSISNLEKHRKPINPMVNAGALVITSMIKGKNINERIQKILNMTQKLTGNPNINCNNLIAKSEYDTADLNRSLCFLLKEYKIIEENVEELLHLYTLQCSIEMNSIDLSHLALVLANKGIDPENGDVILSENTTQIINTVMFTCGMYNTAGHFALNVGIPAKSGVSGALIGIAPNKAGIGIYGPSLNKYGNSIAGVKILEILSSELNFSIFS